MPYYNWYTDLHFDHLEREQISDFHQLLSTSSADGIFISGDISEGSSIIKDLTELANNFQNKIYFVLGNHDFYNSSFKYITAEVKELCKQKKNLIWMSTKGIVRLTKRHCLIGHDSWYDGRNGNYDDYIVELNDFLLIKELAACKSSVKRLKIFQQRADKAVKKVKTYLPKAMQKYKEVFFLTHIPPYHEVSFQEGKINPPEYLPYYSCKIVGDTIKEIAQAYPDSNVTILCGHTHSPRKLQITENISVEVGRAMYGFVLQAAKFTLE